MRLQLTKKSQNSYFFQIRGPIVSICSWWLWIAGFLVVKLYPSFENSLGIDTIMIFFAVASCLCGIFTIFYLPETKGRDIEEIAKSLGQTEKNKNIVKSNNASLLSGQTD